VYADHCFAINKINDIEYEQRHFAADTKSKCDDNVEKEKHEKLSIGKSDTVRNPRTVMIHVKNTSLAG